MTRSRRPRVHGAPSLDDEGPASPACAHGPAHHLPSGPVVGVSRRFDRGERVGGDTSKAWCVREVLLPVCVCVDHGQEKMAFMNSVERPFGPSRRRRWTGRAQQLSRTLTGTTRDSAPKGRPSRRPPTHYFSPGPGSLTPKIWITSPLAPALRLPSCHAA